MISVRSEVQVFPGPPGIRSRGSEFRLPTSGPWGCSSVGRAPALKAGGHRFYPVQLHQDGARRPRSARGARARGIRLMGCDIRFWSSRKRGVRRAPLASSPRWRGAMFDMVKRLCGRGGGPAGLPARTLWVVSLVKVNRVAHRDLFLCVIRTLRSSALRAFGGCLGTERR